MQGRHKGDTDLAQTWLDNIHWTSPRTVHDLTAGRGARMDIPAERGFYAFTSRGALPSSSNCLYVGVAAGKRGIYGRLGSYLRGEVTVAKAAGMKHRGKRLLSFARIRGLSGTGKGDRNTPENDRRIFVSWAVAPLDFSSEAKAAREYIYMLERALIDRYRPLYNTADWERDLELELDEDPFWPLEPA